MLARESIVGELRKRRSELESRFGVKAIGLFGSYVRGEAVEASDMDFLVEFDTPTFDHYMDLKFFLEEMFGVSVDLVSSDAVKPRLKPYIDRDIIYA
jgi:predicted nucleotidyltransferase